MRSLYSNSLFAFVAISFLCLVGCGERTATVKGVVTYRDKPVDYGSVVFVVDEKTAVQAQLETDGSYIAKGVPYGSAKIAVHSRRAKQAAPPQHSKGTPKEYPAIIPKGVIIPEMYNDKETSGLTLTIEQDLTEYNITLKDPVKDPE